MFKKQKARYKSGEVKRVALWVDVVEAMDGKPYGAINNRCPQIANSTITRAKNRGYFSSEISEVLHRMTMKRLKLVRHDSIKTSND